MNISENDTITTSDPSALQRDRHIWAFCCLFAFLVVLVAGFCWAAMLLCHRMSLEEAASKGDFEEVKWLIAHGAEVNGTAQQDAPLLHAASWGHREIVEYLVSHGADINSGRERGRSALIQAIVNDHCDLAAWLIAHGAEVNIRDETNDTPLHYAAQYGNADIVRYLISHGAAIDAQNAGGRTPLFVTIAFRAARNDPSVAKVLLEQGADPRIGTTNDCAFGDNVKTPLQLAKHLKLAELEQLLKDAEAKYSN